MYLKERDNNDLKIFKWLYCIKKLGRIEIELRVGTNKHKEDVLLKEYTSLKNFRFCSATT